VTSSRRGDRAERLLLDLVLVAVGGLLGLIGSLLVPLRIGSTEGLAAGIALVGNFAVGLIGGLGTRSARGALVPGVGWFLVVAVVSVYAPGGDVIIPGKILADPGIAKVGVAFLLLGVVGVIAAIFGTALYTRRPETPTHSE
jgi:hypothetical protein